jgi:hypothetical protein
MEARKLETRKLDDWTADEWRQLEALARERVPSAELEVRTMTALRERGLLAGAVYPRRRRALVLVLAMAASAVFAAGAGVGYVAAMRAGVAGAGAVPTAGARPETLAVQTVGWRQVTWY